MQTTVKPAFTQISKFMNLRAASLAICLLGEMAYATGALPNTRASFGASPSPFKLDVDLDFIAGLRRRVAETRLPTEIPDVIDDGPVLLNATTVRDFWVDHYDWSKVQASINEK